MREPARLHPDDIKAIADAVARLLRAERAATGEDPSRLLTATDVAERFQVSRAWVYSHAQELGAVRLGDGRKPRLRFDASTVAAALARRSPSDGSRSQETRAPARDPAVVRGPLVPIGVDSLPQRWRDALGQAAADGLR